jgi:hypothetical protein
MELSQILLRDEAIDKAWHLVLREKGKDNVTKSMTRMG